MYTVDSMEVTPTSPGKRKSEDTIRETKAEEKEDVKEKGEPPVCEVAVSVTESTTSGEAVEEQEKAPVRYS